MTRSESLQYILDNSRLINQIAYNKYNRTSYDLRQKIGCGLFLLIIYENGIKGFDLFTICSSNSLETVMKLFDDIK